MDLPLQVRNVNTWLQWLLTMLPDGLETSLLHGLIRRP